MKNLISILIIMISLMAFGFFGLLLTLDYKKVQQDLTILLAQHTNNTAGVIGRVEVRKVPFPAIIIHDITIPGVLNAKEALVDFTIRSLLRRNPQINKITIDEPSLHLVIHANYEDDNLSYGRATLRASHIGEFLSNYPDLQDAIVGTIPADSTNITFDIVASDQYLTLTNMDVKSQFMTCSGQVALSRAVGLASNLKLNCDQIRLVDFELQNVAIMGDSNNDILTLTSASGALASGGTFDISGNITKNAYRSLFDGQVAFKHNDLNIVLNKLGLQNVASSGVVSAAMSAHLRITPIEILLHNITGQAGSLQIGGNCDVMFIGDTPRVLLQFNINGLDSGQEYPVITPILKYATSLFTNTQDSSYLIKFTPMRDINFLGSFDIAFGSPIIMGHPSDSLKFTGNIAGGKFTSSFDYLEGLNHLAGSLELITASLKPELHINIAGGAWNTDNLTIPNILAINNELQKNDLSKVKLSADIDLASFTQGEARFENVQFKAVSTGNLITIENLSARKDSSDFQVNGNIKNALPMTVDLAYIYNGFNIGYFVSFLGASIGIDGIANSVGTISTNGTTTAELLYNMYAKSKFISNSLDITGCDIDGFVTKLSKLDYDVANLDQDFKLATNSGGMRLHQITGDYGIDAGLLYFKNVVFSSDTTSGSLALGYNIYSQDFNFSSLWSLYMRLSEGNNGTSSFGVSVKKDGQNFIKHLDNTQLLKSFDIRANRNPNKIMPLPSQLDQIQPPQPMPGQTPSTQHKK